MSEVVKKELPEGWSWTIMDEISDVVGGGTPKSKEKRFYDGGNIPWLTPADLSKYKEKYVSGGARYITEEGLSSSSARMVPAGTVLFTSRAPIGYVVIAKNAICTNQGFKSFVLKTDKIIPDYVYWWLKGNKQLAESFASGTTFLELSGSKAKQLPIPIAPLEQQKHIVAKIEELFSHIDAGIAALNKAKQLLKQYRQSVLKAAVTGKLTEQWRKDRAAELAAQGGANAASAGSAGAATKYETAEELLERILQERRQKWEAQQLKQFKAKGKIPKDDGWKGKYEGPEIFKSAPLFKLPEEWMWTNIGQLGEVIGGLTKNRKREQFKQQLPYLRVANVYANELRLDDVTKIGVQENELDRVLLEEDDLLIVEGNGSPDQIGRLAIWDGSIKPCVHQNHIIKVRLQEKSISHYLLYWMSSLSGREAILQVASSTSGLYTLSISKISALPIPLPPLNEQLEIYNTVSSKLSSIERLEDEIEVQLVKAEKNKQSTLAMAFSGGLYERL